MMIWSAQPALILALDHGPGIGTTEQMNMKMKDLLVALSPNIGEDSIPVIGHACHFCHLANRTK